MSDFYELCKSGKDVKKIKEYIKTYSTKINILNNGLYGACEGGHYFIVSLLLDNGANDFNLGLKFASYSKNYDIINLLIKKGATWFDGGLFRACQIGDYKLAKYMIDKGATDFNTAFRIACSGNNLDIIMLLIKYDITDWNGGLPFCAYNKNLQIAKLLIDNGATNIAEVYHYNNEKHKTQILSLIRLGIPIVKFNKIFGYNKLVNDIKVYQSIVFNQVNNYLITDLAKIVSSFSLLE